MVRIATLDGVKLYIYVDEHPPPHFHAVTAEYVAQIAIDSPRVLNGSLPLAIERRVLSWAGARREALMAAWDVVQDKRKPRPIE